MIITNQMPLYHRMRNIPNEELCHIWNRLTNPSKARLETAHKAASKAAKYIKGLLQSRNVKLYEWSDGAIYPLAMHLRR